MPLDSIMRMAGQRIPGSEGRIPEESPPNYDVGWLVYPALIGPVGLLAYVT